MNQNRFLLRVGVVAVFSWTVIMAMIYPDPDDFLSIGGIGVVLTFLLSAIDFVLTFFQYLLKTKNDPIPQKEVPMDEQILACIVPVIGLLTGGWLCFIIIIVMAVAGTND